MKTDNNVNIQDQQNLKQIPKWTEQYAKNRPFSSMLIALTMLLCVMLFLPYSLFLARKSHESGHAILAWVWGILCFATLVFIFVMSVPPWNRRIIGRIEQLFYKKEGFAGFQIFQRSEKNSLFYWIILVLFISCIPLSVFLGNYNIIPLKYSLPILLILIPLFLIIHRLTKIKQKLNMRPALSAIIPSFFVACISLNIYLNNHNIISIRYQQPFSALYVIPFLIFIIIVKQKANINFLLLIWPTLYFMHALFIVMGIPIYIEKGPLIILNMLIPTFGYGALTGVIGLIYSRYALKKLKDAIRE